MELAVTQFFSHCAFASARQLITEITSNRICESEVVANAGREEIRQPNSFTANGVSSVDGEQVWWSGCTTSFSQLPGVPQMRCELRAKSAVPSPGEPSESLHNAR